MRVASMLGKRIRDWQVEELLGEGGMGQVWRARHTRLNRNFAIKVIADELMSDKKFEELFIREAGTQAELQHPHIIPATDFFVEDDLHCLVMPYIDNQSLEERMDKGKDHKTGKRPPLPLQEAVAIALQVLQALDYAHQHRVIHRDVKPSNILLDRRGNAYLTDFGVALRMDKPRTTSSGKVVGTSAYMSPEQIQRPREMDHRTDVYSFGCVLYEMLAGGPVFETYGMEGDTDFFTKESHIKRMPTQLSKRNPSVPASVEAVVTKALAKSPNDRFGGCGEFARELGKTVEGTESLIHCPHCRTKNKLTSTTQLAQAKCSDCRQPFIPVPEKIEPPKPKPPGWVIAIIVVLGVTASFLALGWGVSAENKRKEEAQRRSVESRLSDVQNEREKTERQLAATAIERDDLRKKVNGYEAPATIILHNSSDITFQNVYMSKRTEDYGDDRLGRGYMRPNEEIRFNVSPGVTKLKINDDVGGKCEWPRIDVLAGVEKKIEVVKVDSSFINTCRLRPTFPP